MSMEVLLPFGTEPVDIETSSVIRELCTKVECNYESDRVKYRICLRHKNR
jgi:hypothetical protein